MRLSERAQGVCPSPTLVIDTKVKQMRADGIDIMGLGAGEPDFDTPDAIKAAAIRAIDSGFTKYTPAGGTQELKQAICDRMLRDFGMEYTPAQAVVCCGAKHCLYNIMQVLCNPGDEVIILAPYWVSYPEMVKLAGGVPVIVPTVADNGFRPDAEAIRAAVTCRTRAIIVNSPSNPTGAIMAREDLEAIATVAMESDICIVSDEIYDRLVYGVEFTSIATLSSEVRARTIVVNGMSKTYAMTGWRIGYALGDRAVIAAMADVQSHSTSNPTSIAQKAAMAALVDASVEQKVVQMVAEFGRRRTALVEALNTIKGFRCPSPDGAFYAFPDVSSLYGKAYGGRVIEGSDAFADMLLSEAGVAVVPGSGFGADRHIRLSYATSLSTILTGVERIREFVGKLA